MRTAIWRHGLGSVSEPYIEVQASRLAGDVRLYCVNADLTGLHQKLPIWQMRSHGFLAEQLLLAGTGRSPSLERAWHDFSPHFVLAHFAQDAWRISRVCERLQIPLAVVVHGSDVLTRPRLGREPLSSWQMNSDWANFIRRVDIFLPASDFLSKALARRGVSPEKIRRHYLGVPMESIPLKASCPDFDVVFVGRLVRNKGLGDLIRAAAGQGWRVAVVGDGALREEYFSLAESADGFFEFFGSLSHSATLEVMARARVLCAPSLEIQSGASEGFGLVAVEAAAVGLPVVAYRTGGLAEAVMHRESGILVAPRSIEGLRDALHELLDDHQLLNEMAAAGRRRAYSKFDQSVLTKELAAFLEDRYC